jgi:hypothetical protein
VNRTLRSHRHALRSPATAVEKAKAAYEQSLTASTAAEERLLAVVRETDIWPLVRAVDDAKSAEQTALIDHIAAVLVARFPVLSIPLLRCLGDATGLDIDILAAVVEATPERRVFDRPALPARLRGRGAYPEGWLWWSREERAAWRAWRAAEHLASEAETEGYDAVPREARGMIERMSNTATDQWLMFIALLLARFSRALPAQTEAIAALAEETYDWALPAEMLAQRRRMVRAS